MRRIPPRRRKPVLDDQLQIAVVTTQHVKNGPPAARPSYTHALANPELCQNYGHKPPSGPPRVTRPRHLEAARPAPDRGHEMPL